MAGPQLSDSLIAFLAKSRKATRGSSLWAESYRARDYSAALTSVESELEQSPESVESRLWWILIQLEIGSVPLGALASPVVELLPSLRTQSDLSELALHVCLSLAGKLADKGQLRLGATLAEAAAEISSSGTVLSSAEQADLQRYVLNYYEEELSRARTRREGKEYIARLEQRIEEKKSKTTSEAPEPKKPRARKNSLNSKALFEQALRDDSQEAVQPSAAFGFPSAGSALASSAAESIDEKPLPFEPFESSVQERKWGKYAVAGICLLLLAAFVQWGGRLKDLFHPSMFGEPGLLLAMNTKGPEIGKPVMPSLELNGHDFVSRKMETINSSLAQVGERIKSIGEKTSEAQVDHAALEASEQQLVKLEKKSEDELVPLDDKHDPAEPKLDPRRTPRLDPGEVKNVPVEDLGKARLPREDHPQLRVGPDGRLYGPPSDNDPSAGGSGDARALDGSPLQSYEVQDFNKPKLFRTIVATNVLSAPSLLSVAVTRLERNTSIQVVSRMGQWLELRSTQGRRGYIFAQDAEEAGSGSQ